MVVIGSWLVGIACDGWWVGIALWWLVGLVGIACDGWLVGIALWWLVGLYSVVCVSENFTA